MLIRPDKVKILLIDPKTPTVSAVERGRPVLFSKNLLCSLLQQKCRSVDTALTHLVFPWDSPGSRL